MAGATDRGIMAKLFLADRAARGRPPEEAFDRFFASLTPQEADHPVAAWIARLQGTLDWNENVCDMVSRYFRIPEKPLWDGEHGNGYEEAAQRLQRRLSGAATQAR